MGNKKVTEYLHRCDKPVAATGLAFELELPYYTLQM
jgi:hypothetical protein